jgi:acyl-coenzyme A synthetase/AMP-(fatty) acid ligase
MLQTTRRPKARVWYKDETDAEIRVLMAAPPVVPAKIEVTKEAVSTSRLQELTLVANTGGVYNPEDWK